MTFDLRIYIIISIFIMVCISLMIFNFAIIYYARVPSTPPSGKIKKWRTVLCWEAILFAGVGSCNEAILLTKLSATKNLVAYSHALQRLKSNLPDAYNDYIHKKYSTFQSLANMYRQKNSIERTCYANFVGNFPQVAGVTHGPLVDTLISYIDDSSTHCGANVLRALCSIGTIDGVVNALQAINDKSLFMHNQLLTNELLNFRGDKETLAEHLWSESRHWNDNIIVSVIQFITKVSNRYREMLMPMLQDSSVSIEVRTAIIRYYGEYIYDPARPILIEFITNSIDSNLTIEAVSALALYPAPDTIIALKSALSNPNWNVRYNASSTLVKLIDKAELLKILQSESNYAREIADYMLELESALQSVDLQEEMDGEKVSA